MTKRIFRSICAVAIVVLVASLTLVMGVLYRYFTDSQIEQLKIQTEIVARAVDLEKDTYLASVKDDTYRMTWIDATGKVLYDNRVSNGNMENHLQRKEVKEAMETGSGSSHRYSTTLMEHQFYFAERLSDGSVVRLSTTQLTWWGLLLSMLQPILFVFVIALAVSFFIAFRLSKRIVEPLNYIDLDNPKEKEVYEELTPLLRRIKAQKNQIQLQEEKLARRKNEFKKTEQIRREFTANVSHELKTPLQTIAGSAELLSGGMVEEKDVPHFSHRIYMESKRLMALLEDVIKLSHLDEGTMDFEWEKVDLYELAKEEVGNLLPMAEKAEVELSVSGKSACIQGNRKLLSNILSNLCDNAIKYNKKEGKVEVQVSNYPKEACLSVSDTGIGISKEEQTRIFERFYRVNKSHSKEVGGTGLGLSIVKHGVKLHNGEISIDSVPKEGTTITIKFPK